MKNKPFTLIELLIWVGLASVALGLLITAGAFMSGCTTSDGTRVGTISKFSNRGVMIKSHEGELVLGGQVQTSKGGSVANVWEFSCLDLNIVPALEQAMDSNNVVAVKYHQTFFYNPFRRDTSYLVKSVTVVPAQ